MSKNESGDFDESIDWDSLTPEELKEIYSAIYDPNTDSHQPSETDKPE